MYISIFISFIFLILGTYLIWPSRYNIAAHLSLAFFPVQYMIPTLILPEIILEYDTHIVELYQNILALGAFFYIFGMLLGYKIIMKGKPKQYLWNKLSPDKYTDRVVDITKRITIFGSVGLIFSFAVMGFIPMFASDPFSAKFFRGIYAAPYARVAVLYRTCHYFLQFAIPILLVIWFYKKEKKYLIMGAFVVCLLALSLTRSPAFSGLLLGLGIIVATKKRHLFKYYIILLFFIFSIGSSMFYIIGVFTGSESFKISSEESSIYQIMSDGSPDVKDQLVLLTAFEANPQYTYGRTFLGGLVPGRYKWNPSVWTLSTITGGANVDEISSGGLRLPMPLWGYVSFSWLGVVFLSLITGFLSGKFIKITKRLLSENEDQIVQAIIILLYMKVFLIFINFYTLSMYAFPIIFITLFYIYNIKISLGKKRLV